jgi:serine protease
MKVKGLTLFMLCAVLSGLAQKKDRFTLPHGLTKDDYASGIVLVKVREQYRDLFSEKSTNARAKTPLNIAGFQSIVPEQSKNKRSKNARSSKPQVDISLYYKLFFDNKQPIEDFINSLYATGYFEIIEPAYAQRQLITPNDPSIGSQYYLGMIKAYSAWDISTGSDAIVIGIVDSGGDLDHPDLQGKLYINEGDPVDGIDNDNDGYIDNYRGWDFSGAKMSDISSPGFIGDNNPSIIVGGRHAHGTKVAGIAAAAANNAIGIAGVGYNTKLLFTKHFADDQPINTNFYSSDTYKGVLYAATHGAKIINCSWGSTLYSAIEQDFVRYVTLDLGCLLIAAAGNSNSTVLLYPASYDYVVSVAASNQSDLKHTTSSFGKNIDIVAPGAGMYTTTYDNTYATDQGTSLAAPIVSGAAALVWSANPSFTPLQVAEQLRVTADSSFYINNGTYNNLLGKGRLDILRALTLQMPSIRVANPLFVNSKGLSPGPNESATLVLDFVNYLNSSSSSLTATVTTTTPDVTISNGVINLGVIASTGKVSNSANPFEIHLGPNVSLAAPIEFLLSFDDGTYHDFQFVTVTLPTFQNISENNIVTSICANGRLGFGDTQMQTEGTGFKVDGQGFLYEMGLIMGTSSTDLHNNVRSTAGSFDSDFVPASSIAKITPGERSYAEVFGSFRNAATSGMESLLVSYRSLVWKKEDGNPYNNFVILEYKIKNTTATDLSAFYVGIFADWDVGSFGANDRAAWHADTKLGYVYGANGTSPYHMGIQVLKGDANYFAIDNDASIPGNPFGIYDDYTDEEKFGSVSSGFLKSEAGDPTTGNDVSHVVSSGPHLITAGGEITIVFAVHGASSLGELITSSQYADTVYNYMLPAPKPQIGLIETCLKDTAVLAPQGASTFNFYKDLTGGVAVASGPQLKLPSIERDTVFYISNADNSFESLRTPVQVKVIPKPTASFSYTGEIYPDKTLSFTDESNDAIAWQWNFGNGNTSVEQHPEQLYTIPWNDLTVSLKVSSANGCQDTDSITMPVPKPFVTVAETCYGDTTFLAPQGASKFNFYRAITDSAPVVSGQELSIPFTVRDTTFYISNADFSEESEKVAVTIKVLPKPTSSFSFTGNLLAGEVIEFTDKSIGAVSWQWNFGDGFTSAEQHPQHTYTIEGGFSIGLTVFSDKGCADHAVQSLIVTDLGENLSSTIEVFPMPATGKMLTIKFPEDKPIPAEVTILNTMGNTIRHWNCPVFSSEKSFDITGLSTGVYFVKVVMAGKSVTKKILNRN